MRAACLLISSLLVVLAGCGGKSGTSSESASTGPVLLSYTRSGGVEGTIQSLIVRSDGSSAVTEGIGGAVTARFRLPEGQLAGLRRGLAKAHLRTTGSAPPSGCADCFQYVVTYGGGTVRRYEGGLPASVKPLVAMLQSIVDAHH